MAIIKCKMCGGDLTIVEGATVAECEYCGSVQTVPSADNEKKLTLFARANRLRSACEFDKAAGVYESIVAEFPEEAEAYWGLVLCRYGIEYVDDPATGKKIPTCHRSSFDSVMEDSDFEQAQENADVVARKVYREEAKAIEELRKSILEVSGKEAPYDIFICYKETDEKGERTIDSVIAQDVYTTLTEAGYRVFFSRISLEDKLGTEYEPYIFAALNSAKLMLVFGTDYEYFNAVWVKNEWSRFLSMIAAGQKKTLIPCYKGIDAYDMPKEFAKLQAQDMGKVGAMQDLLRGIDKIMGRDKALSATRQETQTVVVGAQTEPLLKRGQLSLEDGDWQKADGYFDRVLDSDAECAEAYVGKFLAAKRLASLKLYVDQLIEHIGQIRHEVKLVAADQARIDKAVERYVVPNYLSEENIRGLYEFNLGYETTLSLLKKERDRVRQQWENEKLLSRAFQFANGAYRKQLETEGKRLFDAMDMAVEQAQRSDDKKITEIQSAYARHLDETDTKLAELHATAEGKKQEAEQYEAKKVAQRAEERYQDACMSQNYAKTSNNYLTAAKKFAELGDYKDSAARAKACEERAATAAKKEKQKKTRIIAVIASVIVIAFVAGVLLTKVVIPSGHYRAAEAALRAGEYDTAWTEFTAAGEYKDAAERIPEVYYMKGAALLAQGEYDGARDAFSAARGYKDAATRIQESYYQQAEVLLERDDYDDAIIAFTSAGSYQDAADRIPEVYYLKAEALLTQENFEGAITAFSNAGDYQNAQARIPEIYYLLAEALLKQGDEIKAAIAFGKAGSYHDALQRSLELWDRHIQHDTISANESITVGLMTNGTVVAKGYLYKYDVSRWHDIIAVAAGSGHTVGLKADGTVVATGRNNDGECNVSGWNDIISIAAGIYYTVGLKADHTVVAVGSNYDDQCDVSDWSNIVAISAGGDTVGLKADGTVVATGSLKDRVSGWSDIIAVSASVSRAVGLKADGTVVTTDINKDGKGDVSDWSNIVAVSAGDSHTVGLRADGTVVVAGYNQHGECNVSDWSNIVAVSAGWWHTVGLKSDGNVVAAGEKGSSQCKVSDWNSIRIPEKPNERLNKE